MVRDRARAREDRARARDILCAQVCQASGYSAANEMRGALDGAAVAFLTPAAESVDRVKQHRIALGSAAGTRRRWAARAAVLQTVAEPSRVRLVIRLRLIAAPPLREDALERFGVAHFLVARRSSRVVATLLAALGIVGLQVLQSPHLGHCRQTSCSRRR
jgi:hypothetical protein